MSRWPVGAINAERPEEPCLRHGEGGMTRNPKVGGTKRKIRRGTRQRTKLGIRKHRKATVTLTDGLGIRSLAARGHVTWGTHEALHKSASPKFHPTSACHPRREI